MLLKPEIEMQGAIEGLEIPDLAHWEEASGHLLEIWVCRCTMVLWASLMQLESVFFSGSIAQRRVGFALEGRFKISLNWDQEIIEGILIQS